MYRLYETGGETRDRLYHSLKCLSSKIVQRLIEIKQSLVDINNLVKYNNNTESVEEVNVFKV